MRCNGSFMYKAIQKATKDEKGFYNRHSESGWMLGCECQIETFIPAKQKIGVDGQVFTYTYEVFIPKHFNGKLDIATPVKLIGENGHCDEITIQGVDNHNRRYIAIWG